MVNNATLRARNYFRKVSANGAISAIFVFMIGYFMVKEYILYYMLGALVFYASIFIYSNMKYRTLLKETTEESITNQIIDINKNED